MLEEYHFSFAFEGARFEVDLHSTPSSDSASSLFAFRLGAITAQASSDQIQKVNEILEKMFANPISSARDIEEQLRAFKDITNITVTPKVHMLGAGILVPPVSITSHIAKAEELRAVSDRLFMETVAKIKSSNGSKQAIKATHDKLENASLKLCMGIATSLAKEGETVKASHLFFFHSTEDETGRASSIHERDGTCFLRLWHKK